MIWWPTVRSMRGGSATDRGPPVSEDLVLALAAQFDGTAQARLGRSLSIRHVDAGSCNGCELEIQPLNSAVHDLERFGLQFVASPRHADILLVTGPLCKNLREALIATHEAMAAPKWVVAVGDCAADGGVFKGSYAVDGGVNVAVPVDLVIPGCPPTPAQILAGLLTLLEANASGR